MKRNLIPNFILCALMVASCCGSPSERRACDNVSLDGRLYPKVQTQTKSLTVVNLINDDIEGQVAAIGLQGLVNRTSEDKVYVMNSRCKDNHGGWKESETSMAQMGQFWLDNVLADLPKQTLELNAYDHNPAFCAMVAKYKDYVKGVVIYDPELEEATIEAATTIAGQKDALILSPALYEQIKKDYDFPVIEDLRGRFKDNFQCVDWLVDNYFDTACHDVAFTWSHMTTDFKESWGAANKDYVVANKLFTYFLDIQVPEECHYYEKVVKKYPAGTQIMGWTDELKADKLFADYGYFMVPYISVENLTVMSSFPSVKGKPVEPVDYKAEPGTVYIAMLISDGDNLLHTMIYMPYTVSESAAFGDVPVTWVINPAICDLAPRVFDWYKATFDANGQELAAMMGDGSPITDRNEGFNFYCALTKHYLDQTGILTLKQMIDGESVSWNVQPYVVESGYAGTDWRGIGSYEYHMDGNCVHFGTTNSEPKYLDPVLDAAPSDKPTFLSVMIGTASSDCLTYAKELKEKILARNDGHKYVFLRTADLAATYKAYIGAE